MRLYEFNYHWWDEYTPILFTTAADLSESEWRSKCDDALRLAAKEAVEKGVWNDAGEYLSGVSIGWGDLHRAACRILCEKFGMQQVRPIVASCCGSCLIDNVKDGGHGEGKPGILPADAMSQIVAYNGRIWEERKSRMKAKAN